MAIVTFYYLEVLIVYAICMLDAITPNTYTGFISINSSLFLTKLKKVKYRFIFLLVCLISIENKNLGFQNYFSNLFFAPRLYQSCLIMLHYLLMFRQLL